VRTFIILWLGQIVSSVGSGMTYFALTLWVWEQTQSATAIALILVFYQLPQVAMSLVSGMLVDRVPRKLLLMFSDTGAACCTLSVGILYTTNSLQLWNLYLIAAIIGCFGNLQALTYSTTIPLLVPQQHHTRAVSMGAMVGYGAGIFAPALAGTLYPQVGLLGITVIDMGTFAIAVLTLFIVTIPRTETSGGREQGKTGETSWQKMTFGFRYIAAQPSLLAMVIVLSGFAFLNQMGETLYQPLILARTGNNAQILGMVVAAGGVGGMVGAIGLSLWSGFRDRVRGLLFGIVGTGLSKALLGISQLPIVWAASQFGASLHSPLIFSSYMAIWYAKVSPDIQGRVFAADYLIGIVIESTAGLTAGFLADRVFEPAMQTSMFSQFQPIVGTGAGSGIALLYVLTAIGIVIIGAVSFLIQPLRAAEHLMSDHESLNP
jgi:MFS family permease